MFYKIQHLEMGAQGRCPYPEAGASGWVVWSIYLLWTLEPIGWTGFLQLPQRPQSRNPLWLISWDLPSGRDPPSVRSSSIETMGRG